METKQILETIRMVEEENLDIGRSQWVFHCWTVSMPAQKRLVKISIIKSPAKRKIL